MKKVFLRINFMELWDKKINKSPFEILKELGIKYEHYVPQTMYDCIDFWCLSNVKETKYKKLELKFMDKDPIEFIGYGLSKEKANEINNWIKDNI